MRKLTVHRKLSFMGCALRVKVSVIVSDKTTYCGKLGNGKKITVDIPDTAVKIGITTIGGTMYYCVSAGTRDVSLLVRPIMNPANPFIVSEANESRSDSKTGATSSETSGDDFRSGANRIIAAIREYMNENEDCGYTEKDIKQLEKILLSYLSELKSLQANDDSEIKRIVQKTVLAINELSESTDHRMIETDEREDICVLINDAAVAAGYSIPDADLTEEWREW